jgi:hypothetical protein
MDPMAIGLSQAYDQDSMMEFVTPLSEAFVRGNQQPFLPLSQFP